MTTRRRLGSENAKNRERLIVATDELLREEGYAAITARKVASQAGLKVQLVYYYFQSMDDLILEVIRKNTERRIKRLVQALASPDPLRALWDLNTDPAGAIPASELVALANHRESIRKEIVAAGKQFRNLQIDAVDQLLAARGVDRERWPAAGIVTIITALARAMVQDCRFGVGEGYPEAVRLIEQGIEFFSAGNSQQSGQSGAASRDRTSAAAIQPASTAESAR